MITSVYNERFGDSRGEILLKRNNVISATVPYRNLSVPHTTIKIFPHKSIISVYFITLTSR